MCHHTSVCSCACTDWSFPKDIPITLSTLPSWWHQMVLTKETLVHPHPLHTHTHTSRRTKSIALPWPGLFVHLPVCHFGCINSFVRERMFGPAVASIMTDNWTKISVFFPTNELITSDEKVLLIILIYRLDQDLAQIALTEERIVVAASLSSKMSRFSASVTHARRERRDILP